jgi:hypothetical protein
MDVADRIRQLIAGVPEEAAVTLLVSTLRSGVGLAADDRLEDLAVPQVAAQVGRKPATVRAWIGQRRLQGYRLNGRDWRIARRLSRPFSNSNAASTRKHRPGASQTNLRAWRTDRRVDCPKAFKEPSES